MSCSLNCVHCNGYCTNPRCEDYDKNWQKKVAKMAGNKYPSPTDVERHTKQFVVSMSNYILLGGKIDFVKADLQTLYTDLVLIHQNNQSVIYNKKEKFSTFLKELKRR